jgi:hypothetical protein
LELFAIAPLQALLEIAFQHFPRGAQGSRLMSDYRATFVIAGPMCCAAVSTVTDQPWLLREAPRLPLSYCTRTDECACRYQKIPDRRQNTVDRRAASTRPDIWDDGERRRSPGRRATDLVAAA